MSKKQARISDEDIEQLIRDSIHAWLDEDDQKLALEWLDRHSRASGELEVTPDDLDDTD